MIYRREFRYLSAWKAVKAERRTWAGQVQDALEDCMGIACENLPALKGRSAFLTDNSGSAWGACTSEWGTMSIADIGNPSSVIGACLRGRYIDVNMLVKLYRKLVNPKVNVFCIQTADAMNRIWDNLEAREPEMQ